ncbi:MAG: CPBP family intramembrane metalloprotease [Verrucomicrobia bacterium]|nr:CPBP family intramembrane metalloprotease [Verrucomicrobiota bacterium]
MRPVVSLLIYFAAIFAGGALLAPWLYWLAQWLAAHFPALEPLAGAPFHRFVSRALLGVAVLGLWPLGRRLGLRAWGEVGLVSVRGQGRRFLGGFAAGLVSLAVVIGLGVLVGARPLTENFDANYFLKHALNAGGSALVVAAVEEVVFRGVLFGALQRACRWPVAALVSGAIYALVHFFSRPASPAVVEWDSGFGVLAQMFAGLGAEHALLPGALNLTLAGVILAAAFRRTGNLYFSFGLHAGWIFWLKTGKLWTANASGSAVWFWGGSQLVDGWLAVIVLAATAGVVYKITASTQHPADARSRTNAPEKPEKLA